MRPPAQDVINVGFEPFRLDTEKRGEVALRIQVHDEHFLAQDRQPRTDVDDGSGLAHAALLIQKRCNFRLMHLVSSII